MIKYGIGYGQLGDFKRFLSHNSIVSFEELDEQAKRNLVNRFLQPKTETPTKVNVTTVTVKSPEKPSLLSFYESDIKVKFSIMELSETSHSEVFLTLAGKMGWLLEVKTSNGLFQFPFFSKEICEKVVGFIWRDLYLYELAKQKENNDGTI